MDQPFYLNNSHIIWRNNFDGGPSNRLFLQISAVDFFRGEGGLASPFWLKIGFFFSMSLCESFILGVGLFLLMSVIFQIW